MVVFGTGQCEDKHIQGGSYFSLGSCVELAPSQVAVLSYVCLSAPQLLEDKYGHTPFQAKAAYHVLKICKISQVWHSRPGTRLYFA